MCRTRLWAVILAVPLFCPVALRKRIRRGRPGPKRLAFSAGIVLSAGRSGYRRRQEYSVPFRTAPGKRRGTAQLRLIQLLGIGARSGGYGWEWTSRQGASLFRGGRNTSTTKDQNEDRYAFNGQALVFYICLLSRQPGDAAVRLRTHAFGPMAGALIESRSGMFARFFLSPNRTTWRPAQGGELLELGAPLTARVFAALPATEETDDA